MQLAKLVGLSLELITMISIGLGIFIFLGYKYLPSGKAKKWILGSFILATVATPLLKGLTVGNIGLVCIFYLFIALENIFPRDEKSMVGFSNVKQATYNIIRPVAAAWFGVNFVPILSKYLNFTFFSLKDMNLSLVTQAVIFLFLWDFKEYWWHRAGHKFDTVWRMHKVHHSQSRLGVLGWAPSSIVEHVFFRASSSLVLAAVIGFDSNAFPFFVMMSFLIAGAGAHSNLEFPKPGKVPIWAKLIMTPKNHQFHHTVEGMWYNFGFITPIWDIMFGTFKIPEEKITAPYGIDDPEFSSMGFWGDQISPFVTDKFAKAWFAKKELPEETQQIPMDKSA